MSLPSRFYTSKVNVLNTSECSLPLTMRAVWVRFLQLLLAALMVAVGSASGHDSRPVYIELIQDTATRYSLMWRVPDSVQQETLPDINLEGDCQAHTVQSEGTLSPIRTKQAHQGRRVYRCESDVSPIAVLLDYPVSNPSLSTIVRVIGRDSAVRVIHARPDSNRIALSNSDSTGQIALEYISLGTRHIWSGFDHLLFVTCLVLMASGLKRGLMMVTGFTIGHSLTLILATLGLIRVPILPVEPVIALSLVFVAAELLREKKDTWTWRYPLLMASCFGLLHGLGFASAIAALGLPENEIFTALLAFNLGVELGQMTYVIAIMLLMGLYSLASGTLGAPQTMALSRVLAWPVGGLAAFWFMERLYLLVS